jgi:mycothiol synthase
MTLHLPEGFHGKRPKLEDARAVNAWMRLRQEEEWGVSDLTLEDTISLFTYPQMDLMQDFWMIFDQDDLMVAYCHLLRFEPLRMKLEQRLHPDYDTVALRKALLDWGEARARQLIPQLPADARVSLQTLCRAMTESKAREAIMQAGFTYVRSTFRMEIELDAPPPPPTFPEGIVLHPFTLDMARAAHAADDEAFSDHWGYVPTSFEKFEHLFIKTARFDPSLWFVAFEGEEIAGVALCEDRDDEASVNSLSVRRPWRTRGLGLALLHHAFGEFYRREQHKVALYVDAQSLTGATRLYERAGMQVARQYDTYEKELRAGIEMSTQEIEA